jgi:hypothetical protein
VSLRLELESPSLLVYAPSHGPSETYDSSLIYLVISLSPRCKFTLTYWADPHRLFDS